MRVVIPLLVLSACLAEPPAETFEVPAALPTSLDVLVVLDDTTAIAP